MAGLIFSTTRKDPTDKISASQWVDYFENLLNDKRGVVLEFENTGRTFEPILDRIITLKELKAALSRLKITKLRARIESSRNF